MRSGAHLSQPVSSRMPTTPVNDVLLSIGLFVMAYFSQRFNSQLLINDAQQTLNIDAMAQRYGRHKIAVSIFTLAGDPVDSGDVTGSITGGASGIGADTFDAFEAPLDLAGGNRSFVPILDNIDQIQLTASGMDAGHYALVTITSSGSDI